MTDKAKPLREPATVNEPPVFDEDDPTFASFGVRIFEFLAPATAPFEPAPKPFNQFLPESIPASFAAFFDFVLYFLIDAAIFSDCPLIPTSTLFAKLSTFVAAAFIESATD